MSAFIGTGDGDCAVCGDGRYALDQLTGKEFGSFSRGWRPGFSAGARKGRHPAASRISGSSSTTATAF
jgi:hypothetical protein